jgi:hypothetical protein
MATLSAQITNADGSITNLSGTVTLTTTPPPTIVPPPPTGEPVIPATAAVVDMLPFAFACNHDAGTPGSATGTSTHPAVAPDGTPNCRELQFTLTAKGGFIYHGNVMKDASAYDTFCLETCELSPDWSNLRCAEKDMEQVDATGAYVDMATQLDGNRGFVDVTENQKWVSTPVKADPSQRAANVWHTMRIYVQNLGGGMVLYIGIYVDGTYYPLNITAKSQPSAKWGKNILNLQIQYDGGSAGSVTSTVYLSMCRVHCWKSPAVTPAAAA